MQRTTIALVLVLVLALVAGFLAWSQIQKLGGQVAELGGQVFLTTTHPELIGLAEHRVDFEVLAGRIRRLS